MERKPTNAEIAAIFHETAVLLDLAGRPPEVCRRRARTASLIEGLGEPAHVLLAEGRLGKVKGIGGRTVAEVRAVVREGRLGQLEELRRLVPPTLIRLLDLPELDVARLRVLWLALGVVSIADLDLACRENRVRDLPDLGPALQTTLANALRRGTGWGKVRFLDAARATTARLLESLQREPAAIRLGVAGGVRRMDPLVERIDLLATAHDVSQLLDAFATLLLVAEVQERGEEHVCIRTATGFDARLEVASSDAAFTKRLLRATGPAAHIEALERRAASLGARFPAPTATDEATIYEALDLPWIPPERRHVEDLERAASPVVAMDEVRGVGWLHTDAGAGSAPVETMVERAVLEGYDWVLIADRSPSAFPRGASEESFLAQRDAVADLGTEDIEVFLGLVADVLPDGRLDASERTLARADVVIAQVNDGYAVHGGPQDKAGMTARLLEAVRHPRVHLLDLPPGGCRRGAPPWDADLDAVLQACANHRVGLAWSGFPQRQILTTALHVRAEALGLFVLPAADAHDPGGIDQALLAVALARRQGWPSSRVLSTYDAAGFRAFLDTKGDS